MKVIVTGGAGFIGSHLVDKLLALGEEVSVIDNLSSGDLDNVIHNFGKKNFNFFRADLKNPIDWSRVLEDAKAVFHFAANPDVKDSVLRPDIHFNENVLATFNVLEEMRKRDIENLVFSSSSTVYGEPKTIPTPENYSPLKPISIYGSFKLICENLINIYSELYGFRYVVLRYANIVGSRSTHGVILDFIRKLRGNPNILEILGDGTQKKSYMYIDDAIDATIHLYNLMVNNKLKHFIFNLGSDDWITVLDIAKIVTKHMNLKDVIFHLNPKTRDGRGWIGDVKLMLLDISLLKSTGFQPKYGSYEAISKAVRDFLEKNKSFVGK